MTDFLEIAQARAIVEDDERRLARMRRNGVSEERIAAFMDELEAWKRRLRNLEAAARQ